MDEAAATRQEQTEEQPKAEDIRVVGRNVLMSALSQSEPTLRSTEALMSIALSLHRIAAVVEMGAGIGRARILRP